jgi:RNA polymerase sigma-70 factor (ECF subfamily)
MENIDTWIKGFKRSGDSIWFEKIFRNYMPKIYRFFYFKTQDRQVSEELANEVFVKVFINLPRTNLNSRSFSVWIYKIAGNTLIDHYRKVKKIKDDIPFEEQALKISDTDLFIENSSILRTEMGFDNPGLIRGLSKLTPLQKEVLLLKFVEDLDYRSIAGITGKKQSALRGIIFRALSSLKDEMKK